jgi:hypothetical protein
MKHEGRTIKAVIFVLAIVCNYSWGHNLAENFITPHEVKLTIAYQYALYISFLYFYAIKSCFVQNM